MPKAAAPAPMRVARRARKRRPLRKAGSLRRASVAFAGNRHGRRTVQTVGCAHADVSSSRPNVFAPLVALITHRHPRRAVGPPPRRPRSPAWTTRYNACIRGSPKLPAKASHSPANARLAWLMLARPGEKSSHERALRAPHTARARQAACAAPKRTGQRDTAAPPTPSSAAAAPGVAWRYLGGAVDSSGGAHTTTHRVLQLGCIWRMSSQRSDGALHHGSCSLQTS